MDASRVDTRIRALTETSTRRGVLDLMAALPLPGRVLVFLAGEDAEAKSRRKRRRRTDHDRELDTEKKKKNK